MLTAVISDVHNNLVNLEKVLNYCKNNNIRTIICCGDLASLETLDFLNDNFWQNNGGSTSIMEVEPPHIYYTFGNMDNGQLQDFEFVPEYKKTKIFKNYGEVELENKKIAFVHYPDAAKKLCETGKYTHVFYGHTHKPWTENINNCIMLNPGNVAGEIYLPTFAVWDTKDDIFQLVRIHNLK